MVGQRLAQQLEEAYCSVSCVDFNALSVIPGEQCWVLYVDALVHVDMCYVYMCCIHVLCTCAVYMCCVHVPYMCCEHVFADVGGRR